MHMYLLRSFVYVRTYTKTGYFILYLRTTKVPQKYHKIKYHSRFHIYTAGNDLPILPTMMDRHVRRQDMHRIGMPI